MSAESRQKVVLAQGGKFVECLRDESGAQQVAGGAVPLPATRCATMRYAAMPCADGYRTYLGRLYQ